MTCRSKFAGLTFAALAGVLVQSGCDQSGAPNGVSTTGGNSNPQGGSGPQATGGQAAGTGGQFGATGGATVPAGTGGGVGSGGTSAATGGASGGSPVTGGALTSGGTSATGGTRVTGGTSASGGTPATGGAVASGGSSATGGTTATGGVASLGGTSAGGSSDAGVRDSSVGDASKGGTDGGGIGTGGTGSGGTGAGGAGGGGTAPITLWLAGDSTMATGSATSCPVGWGGKFQPYFNSNAKVTNSAVGGTTLRSWLYPVTATMGADGDCTLSSTGFQSRWTTMANGMKAGDYLFVQFGINDTTSATCPKHVSLETFKQLLGMMAQAAKDKGANPVFLTSVSSISCNGSTAQGTRGVFAVATKEAGTQYSVPVIDLEQLSVALYTASGFCPSTDTAATFSASTPIGDFFCVDHTHFEAAGATKIAGLVAKAIKDQGFPLASYLVP